MDQGIKSRPRYNVLRLDPTGRRHLLLTDGPDVPAEACADALPLAVDETWTVTASSEACLDPEPLGPGALARTFRSVPQMLATLRTQLGREKVGLRLYVAGTEAFLWDVDGVARAAGMGLGEIFLTHSGSKRRRVQCVHCKTMLEDVTTSIVPCLACGANLFVRDHFSRRLGAFQGVRVDAEVPGEVPAAEEIYR